MKRTHYSIFTKNVVALRQRHLDKKVEQQSYPPKYKLSFT